MSSSRINISVGIAAHNEEKNIKALLESIINQDTSDVYVIHEIIVILDGCTDGTLDEIRSIDDQRITIVNNREQKGKAYRLGQLYAQFTGDVLVYFDADCVARHDLLIHIAQVYQDTQADLMCGTYIGTYQRGNLIAHTLHEGMTFLNDAKNRWNNGENLYSYQGRMLVLSNHFAKSIRLPSVWGEDIFMYLHVRTSSVYTSAYIPDAVVYYKLSATFDDYYKQSARFDVDQLTNKQFFPSDVIKESLAIPLSAYLRAFVTSLWRGHIYFIGYIVLKGIVRVRSMFAGQRQYSPQGELWQPSASTK